MSTGSSFNVQLEISEGVHSKRLRETTDPPSIRHPNREQALKRARLTAGFPNIVNGQRIDSSRLIRISDPVTGEELASVTDTQKDGLDQAVRAAKAAFPLWSSKTWNERRDLLASAMEELKAHTDELCTILTAENGRPYSMAQFEVTWILETYAPALLQMELPDTIWNETGVGQITKRYVSVGVVAAISPWNLPFWLSFTKVLPALLTGNTVVLKPAVFTPLTVLRAVDYIRDILPPGVLNVISGGDDLGPWMTSHPDFQKVSFTGSSETGCKVFGVLLGFEPCLISLRDHEMSASTPLAPTILGENLLLILLLISGDLALFQLIMNAEDNFKSSTLVFNESHTNTHQPSITVAIPPLHQTLKNEKERRRFMPALFSGFTSISRDQTRRVARKSLPSGLLPVGSDQIRAL
jgi:hypothetical protein